MNIFIITLAFIAPPLAAFIESPVLGLIYLLPSIYALNAIAKCWDS